MAPHDVPKEDTGGGTTSGSHQIRLFVQTQAHGVESENAPRVLHLAVISQELLSTHDSVVRLVTKVLGSSYGYSFGS